jgi:MFS family permease
MTDKMDKTSDLSSYPDAAQRKRTMRLSIAEGMIALVMIGLTQNFYIPYLNEMKASKLAIGIGFGGFLLAQGIVQIWAPMMIRWFGNYKKFSILGTGVQALLLIPFAMMVHWFPSHAVWLSIGVMVASAAAGGCTASTWSDWISYIVPRKMRGRYFSFRTAMTTLSQFIASIVAALILDRAEDVIIIFTVLWIISAMARGLATTLFCWHYDPPEIYIRPPVHIKFMDFIGQMHTHSYGKFILAFSLIYFGAYFSAPFFTLHMINDLHFSYLQYSCIQMTVPLVTVFSLKLWGRICDRLGNIMPMRLTATIILLLPLGWLISGNFWYLLGLNAVSGLAWGGFQLLTFNYSIGELPSGQRLAYISYMNAIAAIFFFAGSALGGWVGPMLPTITLYQIHSIFIFSTILRLPAVLLFQALPADKPSETKMSAMEKFFFNPRRFILGRFSR